MCAVRPSGGKFALGHGAASYWLRGERSPDGGRGFFGFLWGNSDGQELPSAAVVINAVHNQRQALLCIAQ